MSGSVTIAESLSCLLSNVSTSRGMSTTKKMQMQIIHRSLLQRFVYDLSRILVRTVGWLLFGLRLSGIDKFPKSGAALVCSNHQSALDAVLLGGFCDRQMSFLAREGLFRWWPFAALIRFYNATPVKRAGMGISGLKEALRRLAVGELVVIFPEGRRSRDGEIGPLKSGFCVLARKSGVPLVPVAIAGAYDVWPTGKRFPRLTRICLVAGDPIPAKLVSEIGDEQLVALVSTRIRECFDEAMRLRAS